ncbi:unnamed protein product [Moneuplotes crassus]|uniref:Thioredoxin-like fold domain-containing protein n=1 Tax=Euplotes crassus TaxID=5936 RepID=A0AAD1X7K5_EUPCR|nr:unnamed protein product [Moneuplotes crassus]
MDKLTNLSTKERIEEQKEPDSSEEDFEQAHFNERSGQVNQETIQEANKTTKVMKINLNNCKYPIICDLSTKEFCFKQTEGNCWDILWSDSGINQLLFKRMKLYQKVNHFPGMYMITRKNQLCHHLKKLAKSLPEEYSFFPESWALPTESYQLKAFSEQNPNCIYIVKPEGGAQGKGIYLTRKINSLLNKKKTVIQRYIEDPYLINGYKFDLRLYVLVTCLDPLKIFFYDDGLARFSTQQYSLDSINFNEKKNLMTHLTNYSIVKNSYSDSDLGHSVPRYILDQCKKTLGYVLDKARLDGYDTDLLMKKIHDIIVKTIITIQPKLLHTYNVLQPRSKTHDMCFEILGFDILLEKGKNKSPYKLNELGEDFRQQGGKIQFDELCKTKEFIILFFGAIWYPASKELSTALKKLYKEANAEQKNIEVIYISSDERPEQFEKFYSTMPWLAIEYKDKRKQGLKDRYQITTLPTVIILNMNGDIVSSEARNDLLDLNQKTDHMEDWRSQNLTLLFEEGLKPWLIEVNHMPSFGADTEVDKNCKESLIRDTFSLLNIDSKAKKMIRKKRTIRETIESRIINGIKEKRKKDRNEEDILKNSKYIKIYPKNSKVYRECHQVATEEWENQNGCFRTSYNFKYEDEITNTEDTEKKPNQKRKANYSKVKLKMDVKSKLSLEPIKNDTYNMTPLSEVTRIPILTNKNITIGDPSALTKLEIYKRTNNKRLKERSIKKKIHNTLKRGSKKKKKKKGCSTSEDLRNDSTSYSSLPYLKKNTKKVCKNKNALKNKTSFNGNPQKWMFKKDIEKQLQRQRESLNAHKTSTNFNQTERVYRGDTNDEKFDFVYPKGNMMHKPRSILPKEPKGYSIDHNDSGLQSSKSNFSHARDELLRTSTKFTQKFKCIYPENSLPNQALDSNTPSKKYYAVSLNTSELN